MLGWKGAEAEDTPCKNIEPNTGLASGEESVMEPEKTAIFLCSKGLKNKCVYIGHSDFTYRKVA